MAGGGIEVPIDGDITPLLNTFAELPGRTKAEMDAVGKVIQDEATKGQIYKGFLAIEGTSEKAAKRATNAVLKEMRAAAKETEKATAAAAKATEAATQDVKRGASVMLGSIVGDVEDVVGAVSALGPAGVAAGTAAAAGMGILAAGLASVWANYELISMMYELANATGELEQEQAALSAALKATTDTMGQDFVPLFDGLIIGATSAVLAFRDLWIQFENNDKAMQAFDLTLATLLPSMHGFLDLLNGISAAFREGEGGYISAAKRLQEQNEALKKLDAARQESFKKAAENEKIFESMEREIEADKKRRAAEQAAAAKKRSEENKQRRQKEAEELAAIQGKEALRQIEDDNDLTEQILQNIVQTDEAQAKAIEQEKKRKLDWLAQYDAAAAKLATDEQARAQAVALAQQQAALTTASQWGQSLESVSGLFEQLTSIIVGSAEEGSAAQQRAALMAFRVNQAASIAAIAINTAVAIVKALAEMGPLAGGLASAGIAATGVAQAAAVAATPPPTFHVGGVVGEPGRVGSSGPNAPDEVMVRARRGERVVPRGQDSSSPAPVIVMQYNHRLFDLAEGDRAKRASPYRSLAMHGKKVGRK